MDWHRRGRGYPSLFCCWQTLLKVWNGLGDEATIIISRSILQLLTGNKKIE